MILPRTLLIAAALLAPAAVSHSADEEVGEKSDLEAVLKNATIVSADPQVIEVDFVLSNHSEHPIVLAERWNGWGARQWTILLKDAAGHEFKLDNPQTVWRANVLTTLMTRSNWHTTPYCISLYPRHGEKKKVRRMTDEQKAEATRRVLAGVVRRLLVLNME